MLYNLTLVIAHVKIQFEINSQLTPVLIAAITLVIAHVKIQFEINSQHDSIDHRRMSSCDCSRKNTI